MTTPRLREMGALEGITLETLDWTCACGTAMGLEINRARGGWFDLNCRNCGLVGQVTIRIWGLKPLADDQGGGGGK